MDEPANGWSLPRTDDSRRPLPGGYDELDPFPTLALTDHRVLSILAKATLNEELLP